MSVLIPVSEGAFGQDALAVVEINGAQRTIYVAPQASPASVAKPGLWAETGMSSERVLVEPEPRVVFVSGRRRAAKPVRVL